MSKDPSTTIPLGAQFTSLTPLPSRLANGNLPYRGSISSGTLDPDGLVRDDPAVLVGLAIRFGVMGRVRREGIPASLREKLRFHAGAGEPACALVLDWLDEMLLADLEAASPVTSEPRR